MLLGRLVRGDAMVVRIFAVVVIAERMGQLPVLLAHREREDKRGPDRPSARSPDHSSALTPRSNRPASTSNTNRPASLPCHDIACLLANDSSSTQLAAAPTTPAASKHASPRSSRHRPLPPCTGHRRIPRRGHEPHHDAVHLPSELSDDLSAMRQGCHVTNAHGSMRRSPRCVRDELLIAWTPRGPQPLDEKSLATTIARP